MTPPQEEHRRCPACGQWFSWSSRSGNSFGATTWSDGCVLGPMVPNYTPIARCPSCARWIWLRDAPVCYPSEDEHPLTVTEPPRDRARAAILLRRLLGLSLVEVKELLRQPLPWSLAMPDRYAVEEALASGLLTAERPCPPLGTLPRASWPERLQHWLEALQDEIPPEREAALRQQIVWQSNHPYRGEAPWVAVARREPQLLESWLRLAQLTDVLWLRGDLLRQIERYDEAARWLAQSMEAQEAPYAAQLLALCRERRPEVVPVEPGSSTLWL